MTDTFPFAPERLAALAFLAAEINGRHAPPPIADPLVFDEDGRVRIPVPDHFPPIVVDARLSEAKVERRAVMARIHPGLTFQWAPIPEQGGLLLSWWGGSPDGDADKDGVVAFITPRGLAAMIGDLQAIAAAIEAV